MSLPMPTSSAPLTTATPSRLRRVANLACACVVALVTWEVCARLDDVVTAGAPFFGPYDNSVLYTSDALGMRGRPHARYLKWHLNSLGYRGPELPERGVRVVCLGSSETFGLYETADQEYPRQLEARLNQRAGEGAYAVLNAAYPGMSMLTSGRRLPELLDRVKPQIVVIYPSFTGYIEPPDPKAVPRPPKPSRLPRIAARMETVLRAALPERLQAAVRRWQIEREARHLQVMERLPEENVARFRVDLEAVVDMVRARGGRVVLVTHATRFGARVAPEEESVLVAWRKFYPVLAPGGFLDMEERMNAVVRDVSKERGLGLADAARRMPTGGRYFAEFVHFTDEGASRLAELVAEAVLGR
ncbi:MAG TPA: SGNH/GDSL hydrolase family protein [Polyangia bacterium]|nr:SGNH/GDSL hydrolase family protein [Polyangia bacterium]